MHFPTASRLVLRFIAGGPPAPDAVRGALALGHNGSVMSLHQRLTVCGSLAEVSDILPTTSAVYDESMTTLVVLRTDACVMPATLPKGGASEDPTQITQGFRFVLVNSPEDTLLTVSPTLRSMIDCVTRSNEALICGVRVAIRVADKGIGSIHDIVVPCATMFNALSNASRFFPGRVGNHSLTGPLIFVPEEGGGLSDIVSTLFSPLPPFEEENTILALKIAPVLPFRFRKYQLSEAALWGGLREALAASLKTAGQQGLWLSEGQLIPASSLDMHCGADDEDALEALAASLKKSYRSERAPVDEELHKACPLEEQISYFEVVSVITRGSSESLGGYYVSGSQLEVGDVSESEATLQLPLAASSSASLHHRVLGGLSAASAVMGVVQQCMDYIVQHDEHHSSLVPLGADCSVPLPALQSLIFHGDEGNAVFETLFAALAGEARLPIHVHDCRAVAEKSGSSSSSAFDFGITALIDEGTAGVARPMLLIVRHAELLEGNAGALHAVSQHIARRKGYLIITFCHERSVGGSASPATNSGADASQGGGGASHLASALAGTLVANVACPVPNEKDRLSLLSSLFPIAADVDGLPEWVPSMTLSPALVASWTVGFTVSDILSYVGTVLRTAQSRYFPYLALHCNTRLVLSDEDFFEGLSDYQHSHGLVVSSTKLQPVKWSDVGGLHEAKKEILETIQLPTKYPHLFKAGGMQRKMGILLFGPPGCGKTLLAKAVATEMNMNFLSVKGPELINQYVGESEKNVRDIFQRARDNAPCVLFFDELDALAPARGAKGDAGGAMDRIVSQLLVEMDGVDRGGGDVFIVAATNRPDMLDAALLRPGRFDQRCYLGPPDGLEDKALALRALTRKFSLASDVDLTAVATSLQSSGRYTGADLFALCSDAMLFAVEERVAILKIAAEKALAEGRDEIEGEDDVMQVRHEHFERALLQLRPSVSADEFAKYERLRTNMDK